MNKYETLFIVKPDQTDEQIQAVLDRLTNRVERQDGKVAEINHWGNRRLAYAVSYRGERLYRGYYVLFTYVGEGTAVSEVERNLKILDATFRYLSVKVEENVDVDPVSETVVKYSEKPAEIAEAEAAFEPSHEESPAAEEEESGSEETEASGSPDTETGPIEEPQEIASEPEEETANSGEETEAGEESVDAEPAADTSPTEKE